MQLTTNDKRTLSGLPDPDVLPLSLLAMKPHTTATPDSTDTELDAPIPSSTVSCTQAEGPEAPTPCFKENTIGRRYTLRQFERSVMRSPVTETAFKEILLSWEHGIDFSEQQSCTISKVGSLLGLQHIDWPLNQKEYILSMKVDHLLCTLLFDHGFVDSNSNSVYIVH